MFVLLWLLVLGLSSVCSSANSDEVTLHRVIENLLVISSKMAAVETSNNAILEEVRKIHDFLQTFSSVKTNAGRQSLFHSTMEKPPSTKALKALGPTADIAKSPLDGNTVGTSHGSVCTRNQDCKIKESLCYVGVCLCTLGLYFSPKQNACLRGQKGLAPSNTKTLTSTTALARTDAAAKDPFHGRQNLFHSTMEKPPSTKALKVLAPTADTVKSPLDGNTVGTSHGSVCTLNQDCKIKNSRCYGGVCLCTLGLYFSPKQNACLRVCEEYGDGMDIYKGAGIGGHNDKVLHKTTQTSCLELCVGEKAFTCLTAEWGTDGRCNLSRMGYRDVLFFNREHGLRHVTLGQRRCM